MTSRVSMHIVDDALAARVLLQSAFQGDYRLNAFDSAEACLDAIKQTGAAADIYLLDVDLPGIDGYELCRRIKNLPGLDDRPVIFISGLDDLDSRLRGYDSGGIDYVVKPYDLAELKRKVAGAVRLTAERASLNDKVIESENLTSQILSNLDEYIILIKFLRALNDCQDAPSLFDRLFDLLRSYGLQCAIQLRLPGWEKTLSEQGEDHPLEVAVIQHVRKLDRLFEFRQRAVYNFEHITALVNNMPLDNPERAGRLRDHLGIVCEATNSRLASLQAVAESRLAKETSLRLMASLESAIQDFQDKYAAARLRSTEMTESLLDELAQSMATLGLSDTQEARIDTLVSTKIYALADNFDFSLAAENTLKSIADELTAILHSSEAVQQSVVGKEVLVQGDNGTVELF